MKKTSRTRKDEEHLRGSTLLILEESALFYTADKFSTLVIATCNITIFHFFNIVNQK